MPGWVCTHPSQEGAAALLSVTEGTSYQWNLEMTVAPAPVELASWVGKEMQTGKKQANYSILWLFLAGTAKKKTKESGGSGLDAEPG